MLWWEISSPSFFFEAGGRSGRLIGSGRGVAAPKMARRLKKLCVFFGCSCLRTLVGRLRPPPARANSRRLTRCSIVKASEVVVLYFGKSFLPLDVAALAETIASEIIVATEAAVVITFVVEA